MKLRTILLALPVLLVPTLALAQDDTGSPKQKDPDAPTDGGDETPKPKKPKKVAVEPKAAEEEEGGTDHEKFVGHLAIGYMGISQIPIAQAGAVAGGISAGNVTTPFIGARYWISPLLGLDVGLGLGISSSSTTSSAAGVSTTTDQPSLAGFGLKAGLPLALAYSKHFTFEAIPEIAFGYAGSTVKSAVVGGPDTNLSGLRFDIGARAGAEVHFGFIGVPQLALQATIGLAFRYQSIKVSLSDNTVSASQSGISFGTTVQDAPWAIFTNNISALYYF